MKEAEKRGLCNLPTAADAIPICYVKEKNMALFSKTGIFSETERRSRCAIMLQNSVSVLSIEALTMLDMARVQVCPGSESGSRRIVQHSLPIVQGIGVQTGSLLQAAAVAAVDSVEALYQATKNLSDACASLKTMRGMWALLRIFAGGTLLPRMEELRTVVDTAEKVTPADLWPMPTYKDLLFNV